MSEPNTQQEELYSKLLTTFKQVCAKQRFVADLYLRSISSALNATLGKPDSNPITAEEYDQIPEEFRGQEGLKRFLEDLKTLNLATLQGLIALGPKYVPDYIQILHGERLKGNKGDGRISLGIMNILEELGSGAIAAVPELIQVLKGSSGTETKFAVDALRAIGGPEAREALNEVREQEEKADRLRLEQQQRRQEEELHRKEAERLQKVKAEREATGKCVFCGNKLGVLDRLFGRRQHSNCAEFRE